MYKDVHIPWRIRNNRLACPLESLLYSNTYTFINLGILRINNLEVCRARKSPHYLLTIAQHKDLHLEFCIYKHHTRNIYEDKRAIALGVPHLLRLHFSSSRAFFLSFAAIIIAFLTAIRDLNQRRKARCMEKREMKFMCALHCKHKLDLSLREDTCDWLKCLAGKSNFYRFYIPTQLPPILTPNHFLLILSNILFFSLKLSDNFRADTLDK